MDSKASEVEITVNKHDFVVKQSPGLLTSNRAEGTTGAVLWKVTPLIAEWLSSPENILRKTGVLHDRAWVLELGCGISALIGLAVAPSVGGYVLTDQAYVMKMLKENIASNRSKGTKGAGKGSKKLSHREGVPDLGNLQLLAYDWETSSPLNVSSLVEANGSDSSAGLDLVIACDCIYNDFLVLPFVRACAELCCLPRGTQDRNPTICIVAQQLRSEEVLQAWLLECLKLFHVWRLPDDSLLEGLREGKGFVVHICVPKSGGEDG